MDSENAETGLVKRKNTDDDQSSYESSNPGSAIPTCIVTPTSNEKSDHGDEQRFIPSRKRREFIPEVNKDQGYWEKRRKNNEAARRSREKRRVQDVVLENRIIELSRDNLQLRNELYAIKKKYGIPLNETFHLEENENEGQSEKAKLYPMNQVLGGAGMSGYFNSQISSNRGTALPLANPLSVRPPSVQGNYPAKPLPYLFASTSEQFATNSQQPQSTNLSLNSRSEKDSSEYSPKPAAYNHSELSEEIMRKQLKASYDHIMTNRNSDYTSNVRNILADNESMFRYHDSGKTLPSQECPSNSFSTTSTSPQMSFSMAAYCQSRDRSNSFTSHTSGPHHEDLSDDYSQDQPLSLTVRRRTNSFSGNDSSSSISSSESPVSNSPPAMALPHKLRHKLPADSKNPTFTQDCGNYLLSGLAQLSEIALAQSNPLSLVKRTTPEEERLEAKSFVNPRSLIDPKYAERRKRNNEAARKCRENRKALTQLREVKSSYLENENGKLREELDILQDEMKQLRDLVEKKKGIKSKKSGEVTYHSSPDSESQQ